MHPARPWDEERRKEMRTLFSYAKAKTFATTTWSDDARHGNNACDRIAQCTKEEYEPYRAWI